MDYVIKRLLETIILIASSVLAYWIRFDTFFIPEYYLIPVTIYVISGSYLLVLENGSFTTYGALREVRAFRILIAITFAALITATCLYLTKTGEDFSRAWLLYCSLVSYLALITVRTLAKTLVRYDAPLVNIILLAEDNEVAQLIESNEEFVTQQINVIQTFGCTNDNSKTKNIEYALEFIEAQRVKDAGNEAVKEVWIGSAIYAELGEAKIAKQFAGTSVDLKYLLATPQGLNIENNFINLNNYLVIDSASNINIKLDEGLKLLMDRVLSFLAIIFLFPFFLLIGVLIKFDSAGPVIFRQQRYGINGIEFSVYKFRTMTNTQKNVEFRQAIKYDNRITRVGRFLRRTSLDELPQLFNVLFGSMSLVGPRPHPSKLNEDYRDSIAFYMRRHTVKPGITGLAQIRGFRGETVSDESMEKRIESDLEYIQNWSFSFDLKILALTAIHLVTTDKAW